MTQDPGGTPGDPPQPPPYGQPPGYGQQPPPVYGTPPQQPPQYGQQQYGYRPPAQRPLQPHEERQWAMFAHLGGVLGFVPSLIIFLVFKDRGPFVRDQAREALNFQITMLLAYVAALVLSAIVSVIAWTPVRLNWVVWVVSVVFSVIGGMAANRGEAYRYPFALRLVS